MIKEPVKKVDQTQKKVIKEPVKKVEQKKVVESEERKKNSYEVAKISNGDSTTCSLDTLRNGLDYVNIDHLLDDEKALIILAGRLILQQCLARKDGCNQVAKDAKKDDKKTDKPQKKRKYNKKA